MKKGGVYMNISNTGSIVFNIRTKNSAIPIGDASVTIFDKQGNAVLTALTDSGGTAGPLPIYIDGEGFTYFDAAVTKCGYYDVKIENIPTASSLTVIRNVVMFPVSDYADEVREGTFDITEQRGVQYAELL